MTIREAIKQRHTVRKYMNKEIPAELIKLLNARIEEHNKTYGLNLKLIVGNSDGLAGVAKLLMAKGVNNYFILAGPDIADLDEKSGYCGADLILYAQTLGLNTWWVGGTFNGKSAKKNLENQDVRVNGVITVGYGQNQGVLHKMKDASDVGWYNGEAPQWFTNGIDALLHAPTAFNKMAFTVKGDGNKVSITCDNGHFTDIDLGIGKYHFEVGAGKENFEWV